MKKYIRSMNNVKVEFLDIKPNMIRIDSILLHLAKTCRYHGMVSGWYSNAEHSILCSLKGTDDYIKKAALIHDFGEYITGDVASPVKKLCPDYDKMCEEVQSKINYHFLGCYNLPSEVKSIDSMMTATEQRFLRNAPVEDLDAEPFFDVAFTQWDWRDAYIEITHYFRKLFPDYHDAI